MPVTGRFGPRLEPPVIQYNDNGSFCVAEKLQLEYLIGIFPINLAFSGSEPRVACAFEGGAGRHPN